MSTELRQRTVERDRAIEAIGAILTGLETSNREPDDWERHHIATAINAVFRGLYGLALAAANLAHATPEERAPGWQMKLPTERFDRDLLQRALASAASEPVQLHGTLGSIVLV